MELKENNDQKLVKNHQPNNNNVYIIKFLKTFLFDKMFIVSFVYFFTIFRNASKIFSLKEILTNFSKPGCTFIPVALATS